MQIAVNTFILQAAFGRCNIGVASIATCGLIVGTLRQPQSGWLPPLHAQPDRDLERYVDGMRFNAGWRMVPVLSAHHAPGNRSSTPLLLSAEVWYSAHKTEHT